MFALSSVLLFGAVSPALAAEPAASQVTMSKEEVREAAQAIAEKYGMELLPDNSQNQGIVSEKVSEPIQFKSIEELDAFMKALVEADKASSSETQNVVTPVPPVPGAGASHDGGREAAAFTRTYTDGQITWYQLLILGAWSWKNIYYNYKITWDQNYSNPGLSGISNITSGLTGLQARLSWTQTSASSSFTKNTANLTVKGYYLVGSEVYGVPIGMKYQSTWTNSKTHTFPNWG